jgi:HSP20 family protein
MDSQLKKAVTDTQEEAFLELPRRLDSGGRPAPRIDAHEDGGMFELTAEVPGVPENAIDISLDVDVLTIAVDKRNRNEGKRRHFSERAFGRFRRSIQLPFAPNPDSINAAVEDGLLIIRFPRVKARQPHHVAVRRSPMQAMGERSAIGSTWANQPPAQEEPLNLTVKAKTAGPPPAR